MSDLQISLIIIGVIVIAGVVFFNWVQQVKYRRKVEEAFKHTHEDVLLKKQNVAEKQNERIEPKFDKHALSEVEQNAGNLDTSAEVIQKTELLDNTHQETETSNLNANEEAITSTNIHIINYVTIIKAKSETKIAGTVITKLLQQDFDFNKTVRWFGQHGNNQQWVELHAEANEIGNDYISLKGCLQLADRSGPVTEVNLSNFRDLVYDFANQLNAETECPDISTAHEHAILLDKFCADVDIVIGINIISKDHGAFIGTKIRALAEASGFKLDPEGMFIYRDESDQALFTLNNHENVPFQADNMKNLTTHGITFLLDVPRVPNGEKVFDQMTHIARIFTNTLGGIMVDDNRVPLTDNGILKSKQQLTKIQSVMEANNVPAGSPNAMRLFI